MSTWSQFLKTIHFPDSSEHAGKLAKHFTTSVCSRATMMYMALRKNSWWQKQGLHRTHSSGRALAYTLGLYHPGSPEPGRIPSPGLLPPGKCSVFPGRSRKRGRTAAEASSVTGHLSWASSKVAGSVAGRLSGPIPLPSAMRRACLAHHMLRVTHM